MNILVISQYFWPENFPICNLVQAFLAKGARVDVLTGQPNYPDGQVYPGYRATGSSSGDWHGAGLHRVPLAPRGRGGALRLIANYLSFVASAMLLGPFRLRGKPVDVVFVYAISPILQAIPAIVIAFIKRAKVVIWVQDLWPESLEATGFVRNRWVLAAVRVLVRMIYARADLLLVQSEAFIAPVCRLADPRKVVFHPNSADDVFKSDGGQDGPAIAALDDGFSVVFAGNLGAAQSLETIVQAAVLLRDEPAIRLVLVGSGSRSKWLAAEVERRSLHNVHLAGQYPLSAMPSILRRAGALLVTLKDQEIFYHTVPSKMQAYLAVGRPIIACLNGEGARLLAEADAGISCPAEDGGALAAAILSLHARPVAERDRLGANGQRYFARHFDGDMLTRRLLGYFAQLKEGRPVAS